MSACIAAEVEVVDPETFEESGRLALPSPQRGEPPA